MKSFTSFTPYYAEDVTYTEEDLHRKKSSVSRDKGPMGKGEVVREVTEDDDVTLLDLLRALFPDEWDNFYERVGLDTASMREGQFPVEELRRWASDRAQVLSRTIRGVQRYGDGLRLIGRMEGVPEAELEWLVASKFEYVVTCQIYSRQQREDPEKAKAIDEMRRTYADNLRIAYVDDDKAEKDEPYFSSVLLGVEAETDADITLAKVRLPGQPIIGEGKPENQNHAIIFAHGEYLQTLDMNQDNYLGESLKMRNLLELFRGDVRIVGFPEHVFSVSGGAVAHFSGSNEIVFGSTVQRFLTWPLMVRFHYGHPDVWDKVWAISSGGVAKASRTLHVSEDIFGGFNVVLRGGTIDYAEFIHCGKGRDMSFVAVSGFETKISAGAAVTTVSRDMLRLMRSFDIFRLLSFYSSMAGFYVTTLQSMWSVYLLALAQLLLAIMGMETFVNFEYAEVAPQINVSACDPTLTSARRLEGALEIFSYGDETNAPGLNCSDPVAVAVAVEAAKAVEDSFLKIDWRDLFSARHFSSDTVLGTDATAADGLYDGAGAAAERQITARYTMGTYNTAMFLHLGMLMMVPLFLEQSIQRSIWFAVTELARMLASLSMLFHPFSMQTRGHNFGFAVNYGRAGYVATGRGYDISTSSMVKLFSAYGPSHIYFGMEITFMATLYQFWKAPTSSLISVWGTWSVCISLVLSPWIFNPQALTRATLWSSWVEWTQWLYGLGNLSRNVGKGSWRQWAHERLQAKRASTTMLKVRLITRNLLSKALVVAACGQGLSLDVPFTQSGFIFHSFVLLRACFAVVLASIYLTVVVRAVEVALLRTRHVRVLPLYTTALCVAVYLGVCWLLLAFEHGREASLGQLWKERNVWLMLLAGIAVQAGLVQLFGALADQYEATLEFSFDVVGKLVEEEESPRGRKHGGKPKEGVDEKRLVSLLAHHLRGVHAADISLEASASQLQEKDACSLASSLMGKMGTTEQRMAGRWKARVGAQGGNTMVTKVVVKIVTHRKGIAEGIRETIDEHTASTLRAHVVGDALGDSTSMQNLSKAKLKLSVPANLATPGTDVIEKHGLNTGWRARVLAYAQFWQRMTDQFITLTIFTVLFCLSILPILQVQTAILFNRQFADIIQRKVHRQEVLEDLYTPGLFYKVEADTTPAEPEPTEGRRFSAFAGKVRRRCSNLIGNNKAVNTVSA